MKCILAELVTTDPGLHVEFCFFFKGSQAQKKLGTQQWWKNYSDQLLKIATPQYKNTSFKIEVLHLKFHLSKISTKVLAKKMYS